MDLYLLRASLVKSDGGCLFGNLPRPMWKKLLVPDRLNRVALVCTVVLARTDHDKLVLVDTGCGDPLWYDSSERRRRGLGSKWLLQESLRDLSLTFDQIGLVILTHLHWDHAGGAFRPVRAGRPVKSFPKAKYLIHALELQTALGSDPVYYRAYPERIRQGLRNMPEEDLRVWSSRSCRPARNVSVQLDGGHSPGHCTVEFRGDITLRCRSGQIITRARSVLVAGDNVPTSKHLHFAYNMAYDNHPLVVRQWKLKRLPEYCQTGRILVFSHDPDCPAARLGRGDRARIVPARCYPFA